MPLEASPMVSTTIIVVVFILLILSSIVLPTLSTVLPSSFS